MGRSDSVMGRRARGILKKVSACGWKGDGALEQRGDAMCRYVS